MALGTGSARVRSCTHKLTQNSVRARPPPVASAAAGLTELSWAAARAVRSL